MRNAHPPGRRIIHGDDDSTYRRYAISGKLYPVLGLPPPDILTTDPRLVLLEGGPAGGVLVVADHLADADERTLIVPTNEHDAYLLYRIDTPKVAEYRGLRIHETPRDRLQ